MRLSIAIALEAPHGIFVRDSFASAIEPPKSPGRASSVPAGIPAGLEIVATFCGEGLGAGLPCG